MDTRDKIDNELRDKLGGVRVEPPAGAWERISVTLRSGEATAANAQASRFRIRRPRKIRLGWTAVAAILLCAAVFGSRLFIPRDVSIVEEQREFLALGHDELEALIASLVSEEQAETETPIATERATAGERRAYTGRTVVAEQVVVATEPAAQEPQREVAQDSQGAGTGARTAIPETRRAWMDVSELERMLAETGSGNRQRARRVGVGLFTSSIGNTSSKKMMTNAVVTRSPSDFTVTEKPAGDGAHAVVEPPITLTHRMPLSAGLSVSIEVANRLSIETGAVYTHLLSRGENSSGSTGGVYDIRQELHYVGIPVGVKYDFLRSRHVNMYSGAAGLFEMCIASSYSKKMRNGDLSGGAESRSLNVRGIQPSIGIHAGAEMKITGGVSLYLEPGASYYFEVARQPESYRSEHPLNFSLRAGIRFNLR